MGGDIQQPAQSGQPDRTPEAIEDAATYSVSDAIESFGYGAFQWRMFVLCGAVWAADSLEVMMLAFLMPALREHWDLDNDSFEAGAVGVASFTGMLLGSTFWGKMSDRHGRRFGYIGTAVLEGVFGVVAAFSPNYYFMLASRLIVGFGVGGVPVAYSLFSEFCPVKYRGKALLFIQMTWTIGSVFAVGAAWLVLENYGWRYFLITCSIPQFLVGAAGWLFLPESARWLLSNGQVDRAEKVLRQVCRANGKTFPSGRLRTFHEAAPGTAGAISSDTRRPSVSVNAVAGAQKALVSSESTSSSVLSYQQQPQPQQLDDGSVAVVLLTSPTSSSETSNESSMSDIFHPTLLLTTLLVWMLWGTATFIYYGITFVSPKLFGDGPDDEVSYPRVLLTTLGEIPGLLLPVFVVEIIGRRMTMALCFLFYCTSITLVLYDEENAGGGGAWLTSSGLVGAVFVARASAQAAFGLVYIYAVEVYWTTIRTTGLGLAGSVSRIAGAVTSIVAVDMGLGTSLLLYAAFAGLCVLLCTLLPYEMAGHILPEMKSVEEASRKLQAYREPFFHRVCSSSSSRRKRPMGSTTALLADSLVEDEDGETKKW